MPSRTAPALRRSKSVSAGESGQEALYLRGGEVVTGWIEYFDERMIRLTREAQPNLFIYKEQIHTISEFGRRDESRRRTAERKAVSVSTPVSTPASTHEGATGK